MERAASDLLGHSARLDHRLSLPLLGVPLELRTNSPAVLAVAEAALGAWRDLPPALVAAGPPLLVEIVVHGEAGPAGGGPRAADFTFRAYGATFVAGSGANLLTAQTDRGYGLAFITPELAADGPNLRAGVIELLGLLLASHRDRTPVHAAAVVRNGRAVLLAGPSGSGKSTLCYACLRRGFALLAEDVVNVSLADGLRVWGNPNYLYLLPDAPRFFPELADMPAAVRFNGKGKLAIAVAALAPGSLRTHAGSALVCLMERGPGRASQIEPAPPAAVLAALGDPQEPGFDLLRAQAPAAAAALAAGGAYRLRVGSDLGSAVALLEHLTEDG